MFLRAAKRGVALLPRCTAMPLTAQKHVRRGPTPGGPASIQESLVPIADAFAH